MDLSELKLLSAQLGRDISFARIGKKPQAPVLYQVALLVYRLAHVVEVGMLASLFHCSSKLAPLTTSDSLLRMLIIRSVALPIGQNEYSKPFYDSELPIYLGRALENAS